MTQRERFEVWFMRQWPDAVRIPDGPWITWQAAESSAIERCAVEIDCACVTRVKVLAALEHGDRKLAERECRAAFGVACNAILAADLRAMKGE